MNMKKKIMILVLLIAAIAVVCVSCAKKEAEPKTENVTVSFTVVNSSGKNVTELGLQDRKSGNKMVATPEGGLPDGSSVGFTMLAAVEENAAPDLMFSYTVEGGNNISASVLQKEGTITLVTREDGISFDITAPGK